MLASFPFATSEEIAVEFRPTGTVRAQGALRTLGNRCAVSDGVSESLRLASGKVQGRVRLYCSLNLDAARMLRRGHFDSAARLAKAAAEVEHLGSMKLIVTCVAQLMSGTPSVSSPRAALELLLREEPLRMMPAVWELVREIEVRRAALNEDYEAERAFFGHVVGLTGELAQVRIADADAEDPVDIPVRADDLKLQGLCRTGAPVSLRWERGNIGRSLLVTEPAVELDEVHSIALDTGHDESATEGAYPYNRPLPDAGAPLVLARSRALAAPSVRRPRAIPIGS